jgi:hypothetical protein
MLHFLQYRLHRQLAYYLRKNCASFVLSRSAFPKISKKLFRFYLKYKALPEDLHSASTRNVTGLCRQYSAVAAFGQGRHEKHRLSISAARGIVFLFLIDSLGVERFAGPQADGQWSKKKTAP